MASNERPIHLAILTYLRLALPGAVIHASPNSFGDLNGPAVGKQVAKAKHMGMMPGWPDIEVFYKSRAIFFEVKAKSGRLQDTQADVGKALKDQGFDWFVVRSVDDVMSVLVDLGYVGSASHVAV